MQFKVRLKRDMKCVHAICCCVKFDVCLYECECVSLHWFEYVFVSKSDRLSFILLNLTRVLICLCSFISLSCRCLQFCVYFVCFILFYFLHCKFTIVAVAAVAAVNIVYSISLCVLNEILHNKKKKTKKKLSIGLKHNLLTWLSRSSI